MDSLQITGRPLPFRASGWSQDWTMGCGVPVAQVLTARDNGQIKATLLVQRLPDETMSVVLTRPAAATANQTIELALFNRAEQIFRGSNARFMRLLLPCPDSSHTAQTLTEAGFRRMGIIGRRELLQTQAAIPNSADGMAYSVMRLKMESSGAILGTALPRTARSSSPALQRDCGASELAGLIDSIARDSEDLRDVPPTEGQLMLRLWSVLAADVRMIIAVKRGHPVGLLVVSHSEEPAEQGAPEFTLEYVGVLPEYRREQVASHLLKMVPTAAGLDGPVLEQLQLSAFVDQDHRAATAFYDAQGFTKGGTMELWLMDSS